MAVSILERRNALVEGHLSLVRPIAARLLRILPRSFELDDLIGAGNLGLLAAASRYRPRQHGGTPFSAYARAVIRGYILSSVRRGAYLEATRASLDEIDEPAEACVIETALDGDRLARRLRAEVAELPARERVVIEAHYAGGQGLRPIGCTFGVGKAMTSRLHVEALRKLRRRLA